MAADLMCSLHILQGTDKAWVEDPPARIPYKSLYSDSSTREEGAGKVVFVVLASIFVVIILGAVYELWRTDRRYRRRKELAANAQRIWSQSQHVSYPEGGVKIVSFRKASISKPNRNGTTLVKSDYVPIPSSVAMPEMVVTGTEENVTVEDSEPLIKQEKEPTEKPEPESEQDSLSKSIENLTTEGQGEKEIMAEMETETKEDTKEGKEPNHRKRIQSCEQSSHITENAPGEASNSQEVGRVKFGSEIVQIQNHQLQDFNVSPMFLIHERRSFGNPISYLGRPRLTSSLQQRSSKESVLSLD